MVSKHLRLASTYGSSALNPEQCRHQVIRDLVPHLRRQFRLEWRGIHGVAHWARVRQNGLYLCQSTKANVRVVELFAFLHDSCRQNDGHDPEHGARAADFARSLQGSVFTIPDGDFVMLLAACQGHTHGRYNDNVTVQTCWDADRLDLGRVGIRPLPERLCTAAARDPALIELAYGRSIRNAW